MNGRMFALFAAAALVVVGCENNNPAALQGQEDPPPPVSGPLGLLFDVPVDVMSADVDANTVRVSREAATVTLNSLTFDEGSLDTFSITIGLPDGSEVTITDEDDVFFQDSKEIGDTGFGLRFDAVSDDGDLVNFIIGFAVDEDFEDFDDAEIADAALYVVARVNPEGDNPDFDFDTYLVTGAETDGLPEGSAHYEGFTIASVYHLGVLSSDHLRGTVFVSADFENLEVDIHLEGSGDGDYYLLHGDNLEIEGSDYGGQIAGEINPDGRDLIFISNTSFNVVGDVLGTFFGDDAEATAGVFGATGTDISNHEVEVIGAFGASIDGEDEPQ